MTLVILISSIVGLAIAFAGVLVANRARQENNLRVDVSIKIVDPWVENFSQSEIKYGRRVDDHPKFTDRRDSATIYRLTVVCIGRSSVEINAWSLEWKSRNNSKILLRGDFESESVLELGRSTSIDISRESIIEKISERTAGTIVPRVEYLGRRRLAYGKPIEIRVRHELVA